MPVRRLALLLVWLGLGACAGTRTPTLAEVEAAYVAAQTDELRSSSVVDDSIAAAEVAAARDDHETAARLAGEGQRAARLQAAIATVRDDGETRGAKTRAWRSSSRAARGHARRARDGDALADAIAASPKPQRHARALRRAIRTSIWVYDEHRELGELGERPAIVRERLRHASHEDPREWLRAFDRLGKRGLRDPGLCDRAFELALELERPRAEIVARARAVLAVDAWHLPARMVVAADREVRAGRLRDDAWLWFDLGDRRAPTDTSAVARMQRRLANGGHPLVAYALAHALLRAELVGDAAAVVARTERLGDDADAAALLTALIELAQGRPAGFERWRERHDERSWHLDSYVAQFDRASAVDAGVRAVGAAARRRSFAERERARLPDEPLVRLVLDARTPARVRRSARRELAQHPRPARIALQCERRGLGVDACAELLSIDQIERSGELLDALPVLADADALDVWAWLDNDAPRLRWLASTNLRSSAEYLLAELHASARRGDRAAASAALERSGALLDIATRVAWTLVLEGDGALDALGGVVYLPDLDTLVAGWEQGDGGPPSLAPVVEALLQIGDGAPCKAMAPLRELSTAQRGEVAAYLAAYGAWAALECRDDAAFAWFLGRVQAGAPDAAIAYALRGEQLARAGDRKAAARWFAAALQRDPELALAYDGLERWAELDDGVELDELAVLLRAAPRHARSTPLLRSLANGHIRRKADAVAVRELSAGESVERIERIALLDPAIAPAGLYALETRLQEAPNAAAARALAKRLLALVEQLDRRGDVELRWWVGRSYGLAFLLGRAAPRLRSVPASAYDGVDEVESRLLVQARMAGAFDDAQAWLVWRHRWAPSGEQPEADELYARVLAQPWTHELRVFACTQRDTPDLLATCRAAWKEAPSIELAARTAEAVFATHDAEAQRQSEEDQPPVEHAPLDEAALRELFATSAPSFPAADADANGRWWGVRARHHEYRERHEEAAKAWLETLAFGWAPQEDDWHQLPTRGITIRHAELRRASGDARQWARQAFLALLGGEVGAARVYARTAVAFSADDTREVQHRAGHRLAFVELVAADIASGTLDREALAEATMLMFTPGAPEAYDAFVAAHPKSLVAQAVEVEHALALEEQPRVRAGLAALQALAPEQPLVAVLAMRAAVAEGDRKRARALFLAAKKRGDHPVLDTIVLPESVRGRDPSLPQWLRDPKAVHTRLREASDVDEPRPTRRVWLEQELELWAPESWTPGEAGPLVLAAPEDWSITVEPRPRASRCSGPACATQLKDELEADGSTVLWSAPIETGAGPGTELLVVHGDNAMLVTQVFRGGRELRLAARAPAEHLERTFAALRIARDSLRPLDGVLTGFRAESLRKEAPALSDGTRLAIRIELAHGTQKCPIAGVIAGLARAPARESALVDAWLSTRTPEQRIGLTACAPADAPEAGGIAVLALLDDDQRVHAWGRAAVRANPDRARLSARSLFTSALEPALAHPDHLSRRDLPPRGLLELLGALPEPDAHAMVAELVASPNARDRSLGFAAAGLRPELFARARATELLADPDPRLAALALDFLAEELDARELAAVRARVDVLRPVDAAGRELLVAACGTLADHGGREDLPRMRRAAARIVVPDDADEELRFTKKILELLIEAVERGPEGPRREPVPSPTVAARTPEALAKAPLPQLLPGRDWFYAKVADPRLVWSTARHTLARLSGGDPASRQLLGEIVKSMLERAGTDLLADDSGLDLSRGIECASNPTISLGQVCAAWVTDRERVLTLLAERDWGEDDGLVLPLNVAEGFAKAPRFLAALPLMLPGLLAVEEPSPGRAMEFEERVRGEVQVASYRLHSSLIVRGSANEIDIDEEYYLFVGDRMFAFTTRWLANAVLGRTGPVLADDAEFAALAAELHGEGGIVGAGVGDAVEGAASTVELAVDERGLRFRQLVRTKERVGDAARVIALLPDDAAATWAVGSGSPRAELEATERTSSDEGEGPPPQLAKTTGAVAFAWYPAAGQGLWHEWVLVLEPSAADLRLLGKHKLTPKGDHTVRAGVHAGESDGLFVYASSAALRDRVLAGERGATQGEHTTARGSFRGAPSSAAVTAAKSGDPAFRRFLALGLGVVESADYQASADAKAGVLALNGHVTLSLAADDRPSDVVDKWLASHDDSNAILLPRKLKPRELTAPITYVLEVVDPETFVQRVLAVSPRIEAKVESDAAGSKRVRVTVRPQSDAALALSTDERRRSLAATRDYPTQAKQIRELLPVIVGDERDANKVAAKVVAWVHARIRYEITPRRVDGAKVLELGRGDCSEYATLTVTLLRAAGVPAEERSGMMASGSDMAAHAWAAYHDGKRWHEVDPTAGTASVTAGHIELSVTDILALQAVGGLKVLAIE